MLIYRLEDRLFHDLWAAARHAAKTGLDAGVLTCEEYGLDRPAYRQEREHFDLLLEHYAAHR